MSLFKTNSRMPRDWSARWQAAGGKIYLGRLIAPVEDSIWSRISRFGSPYPPFDFNSGMVTLPVSWDESVKLGMIKSDYKPVEKVVLGGASEGVRSSLEKHFFNWQKQPRKDGFPQQGFWHGNNGQSVAEKIQPTKFAKDTATISIKNAPLAHKLNPIPPPIKPGAGKKYLTLPAIPIASIHPAGDFPNLTFGYVNKEGVPTEKEGKCFPVLMDADIGTIFYYLARKVQTKHDPRALPPPQTLTSSAADAASNSLTRHISTIK